MIIFLDIDGVLNSTEWEAERPLRGFVPPRCAQEALDEERIDSTCVEHLRSVVHRTDARLVVTSTWRLKMRVSELVTMFALHGWNEAPIIGITPHIAGLIRGDEVEAWLANNDYAGRYVCLDDDDGFRVGQPLVRTNREVGMTSLDAARCVEILTPSTRSLTNRLCHQIVLVKRSRSRCRHGLAAANGWPLTRHRTSVNIHTMIPRPRAK